MIRGLIFDLNGTLIDILTNEGDDNLYRTLSNLLDYQGISLSPDMVRKLYSDLNKAQRRRSPEQYPEFDVIALFRDIIDVYATDFTRSLPEEKQQWLPTLLAETFRAASRYQLQLYPEVIEVLDELRGQYRMAAVSDGQKIWAIPELQSVGLDGFFYPVVVSSDFGYRKPDSRIFQHALDGMGLAPEEVIFIGNDMYRDVYGAAQLGMKSVFFRSNQGDQQTHGAEPDYIIYKMEELPEAIRFLRKKSGE